VGESVSDDFTLARLGQTIGLASGSVHAVLTPAKHPPQSVSYNCLMPG
jgi:hypothetical protein